MAIRKVKYNRSNGITKRCPKCGLTKVVEEYYFNKKTGKIYSYCRMCEKEKYSSRLRREYKHNYYLKNKEKYNERSKRWLENNKRRWAEYMVSYRLSRKGF